MVKIRKIRKGEEINVLNIVKIVLSDYGLNIDPYSTDMDLSDIEKYYFNNNGWFAVLEKDNEIIGSYGICKINKTTCELRKMYLLKKFQGQGLGKSMMDDALKKAKELGYSRMMLETNSNLNKALSLYYKYGFTEYKPDHLSDRCDLAMEKEI